MTHFTPMFIRIFTLGSSLLMCACDANGSKSPADTEGPAASSDSESDSATGDGAGSETDGEAIEPDLDIASVRVLRVEALDAYVFEMVVDGEAGRPQVQAAGQLDGAPILGYVFPTSLSPEAVGFGPVDGVLALAVTSHPDFDDTPLWNEDGVGGYDDDGIVYHTHWVVLAEDGRAPAGLAIAQADPETDLLPPTAPMPMYLDSPGFGVSFNGSTLRVIVPSYRIIGPEAFEVDGVTAYMEVQIEDDGAPLAAVHEVYDILSGDLSLPVQVQRIEGDDLPW